MSSFSKEIYLNFLENTNIYLNKSHNNLHTGMPLSADSDHLCAAFQYSSLLFLDVFPPYAVNLYMARLEHSPPNVSSTQMQVDHFPGPFYNNS